jgi:hypothetical protein
MNKLLVFVVVLSAVGSMYRVEAATRINIPVIPDFDTTRVIWCFNIFLNFYLKKKYFINFSSLLVYGTRFRDPRIFSRWAKNVYTTISQLKARHS